MSTLQYQESHRGESKVPTLIGSFVICLCIAYAGVTLRLISRRMSKTAMGMDDWLIILSLLFTTAFVGTDLEIIRYGLGRHEIVVTNPAALAKGIVIAEVFYSIAILLIKSSALFLLHRIFPGRQFTQLLWGLGAIIGAYTITQMLCVVLQCVPVDAIWNPNIEGACINIGEVFIVCSSFNIFSDFAILTLPMPKLWALRITMKQKIQLTVIFLLGGFVCVISIYRQTQLSAISRIDTSWSDVNPAIWSVLECGIATLSACLPTLRPLYNYVFGCSGRRSIYSRNARSYPWARTSSARGNSDFTFGRVDYARHQATEPSSDTVKPLSHTDHDQNGYIPLAEVSPSALIRD